MAYKVFSNGDALTGGELNTYLMNQSVMVFATTTARDAALTTPSEGMVVWLQDADKYVYYTGSAWADLISAAGSGNAIINGAFDIWQRGTSFSLVNGNVAYTADRFLAYSNGGSSTYSQQAFTPGAAPVAGYEGAYFLREVAGAGTLIYLEHKIEDVRTFAGQTATLSFWAKAGSAFTLSSEIASNFGSGGSTGATITTGSHSLTTSWARYTVTVAMPSLTGKTIGTGSSINIVLTSAATAQTLDIWGVQFEVASTATAFKRNASNIQGELAACQRYYYADIPGNPTGTGDSTGTRIAIAPITTFLAANVKYPVPMRTAPTIYVYGNGGSSNVVRRTDNGSTATLSGNNYGRQQNTGFSFLAVSSGVFTANAGYDFQIAVDAEL
jgi:hypothetical protein